MTTKPEIEIKKIHLLQEANLVNYYAIKEIEKELETIYIKQKNENGFLENTIADYFKLEFGITNRIVFSYGQLYIYCIDSDFSHLQLRLDTDKKLSLNWFSSTCNSENKTLQNYLSILGVIAGNMDKIETEFKIWIEKLSIIEVMTNDKNKLHRTAKSQININLIEITKLEKKINKDKNKSSI